VSADERDDDRDRAAILARRRRWIALAVAGATTATACGVACLRVAPPDAGRDAAPDTGADAEPGDGGDRPDAAP